MKTPFTAELIVEKYLNGKRIDSFLVRHFRNYTPFRMQRMAAAGCVWVNDVVVAANYKVHRGERVHVRLIEPPDKLHVAEPLPLDIIHEDPWLIVVNKPAGQIAHPSGDIQAGTLSNALQYYLDCQTRVKGLLRPGIVHRLDQFTSGVTVVSKEHLAHRRLSFQFEQRQVKKTYLALVHGNLDWNRLLIDRPIGASSDRNGIRMSTRLDATDPKPAKTEIHVVERLDSYTLVEVRPKTGRLHQIRVHLSAIGHPIVDDPFYGLDEGAQEPFETPIVGRQALHASRIQFRHPITQETVAFAAPLPPDFDRALNRLRARRRLAV